MAFRKQKLHHRIYNQPTAHTDVMSGMHPAVPAQMVMPIARVLTRVTDPYMTAAVQDLVPLITADGAMVPASAPGRWGQLMQAGRP